MMLLLWHRCFSPFLASGVSINIQLDWFAHMDRQSEGGKGGDYVKTYGTNISLLVSPSGKGTLKFWEDILSFINLYRPL